MGLLYSLRKRFRSSRTVPDMSTSSWDASVTGGSGMLNVHKVKENSPATSLWLIHMTVGHFNKQDGPSHQATDLFVMEK